MLVLIRENSVYVENTVVSDIGYNIKNLDKLSNLDTLEVQNIELEYVADKAPKVNDITYHKDVAIVNLENPDETIVNDDMDKSNYIAEDDDPLGMNMDFSEDTQQDSISMDFSEDIQQGSTAMDFSEDIQQDSISMDFSDNKKDTLSDFNLESEDSSQDLLGLGEVNNEVSGIKPIDGDSLDLDFNSNTEPANTELNIEEPEHLGVTDELPLDDLFHNEPVGSTRSVEDDLDFSLDEGIFQEDNSLSIEEDIKIDINESSTYNLDSHLKEEKPIESMEKQLKVNPAKKEKTGEVDRVGIDPDSLWVINLRKKSEKKQVVETSHIDEIFSTPQVEFTEDKERLDNQEIIETKKGRKPRTKKEKPVKNKRPLFNKDKAEKSEKKPLKIISYLTSGIDGVPEDYKKLLISPTMLDEEVFIQRKKSKGKSKKTKNKAVLMEIVTPAMYVTDENDAVVYTKVANKSVVPTGNSGLTDLKQHIKHMGLKEEKDYDLIIKDDNGILYQTWCLYPECVRGSFESLSKLKKNYIINKIMSVEEALVKSIKYKEDPQILLYSFPTFYKILLIKKDHVIGVKEFQFTGMTLEKIEKEIDSMLRNDVFAEWIGADRIYFEGDNLLKAIKLGSLTGGGYGAIYSRARYYLGN